MRVIFSTKESLLPVFVCKFNLRFRYLVSFPLEMKREGKQGPISLEIGKSKSKDAKKGNVEMLT